MRENFVKLPLLQQREIEMKVMGPLIRAFAEEFGEEKTYAVVRRMMKKLAGDTGRAAGEECGGGLDNFKEGLLPMWDAGGALAKNIIEDTGDTLRFDVTRCDYAAIYKELGYADLGALVSCERDEPFINGFDPDIKFERTKTIMAGDDVCDFCYSKRKNKKTQ